MRVDEKWKKEYVLILSKHRSVLIVIAKVLINIMINWDRIEDFKIFFKT